MKSLNYKNQLLKVIEKIQKPAGNSPKFESAVSIRKNMDEFTRAAQLTFFDLHLTSISSIINIEKLLKKRKEFARRRSDRQKLLELRNTWRRVNDSLAWVIVGYDEYFLKRLCLFREHGHLFEQNLEHVINTLTSIYLKPYMFAVWTDATSFIDVGDILIMDSANKKKSVVELKMGRVNEQIKSILSGNQEPDSFLQQFGKKGKKQLLRNMNQEMVLDESTKEVNGGKRKDLVSGKNINVIELDIPFETYDDELYGLIKASEIGGSSIGVVDGCLWIYVFRGSGTKDEIVEDFTRKIFKQDSSIEKWLASNFRKNKLWPLWNILQGEREKITRPIFLRSLEPKDLLGIISGEIKVLFYFDWVGFSKLIKKHGGKFEWSSEKEGKKYCGLPLSQKPIMLDHKVPMVFIDEEKKMFLGGRTLFYMLYDGIRPDVIAYQRVECVKKGKKINIGSI